MKKFISVICFLLIGALLVVGYSQVASFKLANCVLIMQDFYKQPENSIDIISIGSSHIYYDINPAVIWDTAGYSSYNLAASSQPITCSYYYLVEALKTQSPKLVILDVYFLYDDSNYAQSNIAIWNIYGMKWSQNKIDAIDTVVSPEERFNFYVDLCLTHGRYNDISSDDFITNANSNEYRYYKGFYCSSAVKEMTKKDNTSEDSTEYISEKNEKYYRMFIEKCIEENIQLLVLSVPFNEGTYNRRINNTAKGIAEEYQSELVTFCNFNDRTEAMSLDYATDFSDSQHLNFSGSEKFSTFLTAYIEENYDIPCHWEDDTYESWDEAYNTYRRQMNNLEISKTKNLENWLSAVQNAGEYYDIFIAINGYSNDYYDSFVDDAKNEVLSKYAGCENQEFLAKKIKTAGENAEKVMEKADSVKSALNDFLTSYNADEISLKNSYVYISDGVVKDIYTEDQERFKSYSLSRQNDIALSESDGIYKINLNGTDKTLTETGITILVYDSYFDKTVDTVFVDLDKNNLERES